MATETAGANSEGGGGAAPRSKRKLQKQLRSSGQAYISRTGKLIPAKRVPDELCQCPQKCDDRVPMEARERLFNHFYNLSDSDKQNTFLRRHMDVKSRAISDCLPLTATPSTGIGTGRSPRRITCKYLVPLLPGPKRVDVCQKAFVSAFVITTKRVRLQREKLISSLGLNSYSSHAKIKSLANINNNNNNNSIYCSDAHSASDSSSSETKVASFIEEIAEIKRRKKSDNPFVPFGLIVPESVTITPVWSAVHRDRDIAIVNNFFSNQLWKPEYLKSYS